jgi:hypothetical protein
MRIVQGIELTQGYLAFFTYFKNTMSKAQRSVVLSSTEAESNVISESEKEIKFVYYYLKDLHVEVILKVVNVGAIFILKMNQLAFQQGMWTLNINLFENLSEMDMLRLNFSFNRKWL